VHFLTIAMPVHCLTSSCLHAQALVPGPCGPRPACLLVDPVSGTAARRPVAAACVRGAAHAPLRQRVCRRADQVAMAGIDQYAMAGIDQYAMAGIDQYAMTGIDQYAMAGIDQYAMAGIDQYAMAGIDQWH
jgi:hypothetical protein